MISKISALNLILLVVSIAFGKINMYKQTVCLLKQVTLVKKQHFQSSDICNKYKRVNKNHFLSCAPYISEKPSKC